MARRSHAVVVARVVDTVRGPVPEVPPSWDTQAQDEGWATVWPLGRVERPDVWLDVWLGARVASNGAWLLFGQRVHVDAVVARVTNSWASLAELRADVRPAALQVKAAWQDRRRRDAVGVPIGEIVSLGMRMAGADELDDGEDPGPLSALARGRT